MKRKALTQKQYEYLTAQMKQISDNWRFSRLFLTFPKEAILDVFKDVPNIDSRYDEMLKDFNKNRVAKTKDLLHSVMNVDRQLASELSLIDVNKGRLLHAKRVDFANTLEKFMHIRLDFYSIIVSYLHNELCIDDSDYTYVSSEELNADIIGD